MQLSELPLDQLLTIYCLVAIAFGLAFQTPADLGPSPPEEDGLPSSTGPDFAVSTPRVPWRGSAQLGTGQVWAWGSRPEACQLLVLWPGWRCREGWTGRLAAVARLLPP